MRNLKKLLAVVVAVTMLLTAMIPAFAADATYTYEAQATTLNDLGLMAGNGTSLDLGGDLTREQGVTLFLAMFALTDDAQALTDAEVEEALATYTDAIPGWAKKFVAYAVINKISVGTEENVWGAGKALEGNAFAKWVLNQMGYTEAAYEAAATELAKLPGSGLTEEAAADLKGAIKRDGVAGIIYGALTTKAKDDTKTIIENYVTARPDYKDAAEEAGLYTENLDLKVESVKSLNLIQFAVTFNKEIAGAGDEDNYEIETDGDADLDEDSDFALQSDNKTVVITLTTAAEQQDTIDLTVKDIEDNAGKLLAETTIEGIEMKDDVLPQVLSAEVIGMDTIKVKFSEPIALSEDDLVDYFEVDDGDYYVDSVDLSANNTEANVKTFSEFDEGKIAIEALPGIEDYAGYSTLRKTFELEVVIDETAPVVVGYKDAEKDEVTLIFNKDIEINDSDPDLYYHTNSKNTIDATATDLEDDEFIGKELTLKFAEDEEMSEGISYVYIDAEAIRDLWDNLNDDIKVKIEIIEDDTKPTLDEISSIDDREDAIKLEFSEDMDADTAEDIDNYTLLDSDGDEVDKLSAASFDTDSESDIIIEFTEDLDGEYSIVIQDVEDANGNEIEKVTKKFNMDDLEAPDFDDVSVTLYDAGDADDQKLVIDFGEAMATDGKYSVVDLEKYTLYNTVTGETYELVDYEDEVKIKATTGNEVVEIKIPNAANDGITLNYTDFTIQIARVADAAGNYTVAQSSADYDDVAAITVDGTAGAGVGIDTVEQTSENTVLITLDSKLKTFNKNDIAIFANDTTTYDEDDELEISKVNHTINSDGVSEILITLDEDVYTDGNTTDNVQMAYAIIDDLSENNYGDHIAPIGTSGWLTDEAAPVVLTDDDYNFVDVDDVAQAALFAGYDFVDADDNGTTITVKFSELLDDDKFSSGNSKNGFSVSGGGTIYYAYLDSDDQTVVLVGENFTHNTNVIYNESAGLSDDSINENEIESFTYTTDLDD